MTKLVSADLYYDEYSDHDNKGWVLKRYYDDPFQTETDPLDANDENDPGCALREVAEYFNLPLFLAEEEFDPGVGKMYHYGPDDFWDFSIHNTLEWNLRGYQSLYGFIEGVAGDDTSNLRIADAQALVDSYDGDFKPSVKFVIECIWAYQKEEE